MSEEDGDKGKKTNDQHDFKPEHGQRNDNAPRGSMGRPPSPSGMGAAPRAQGSFKTNRQRQDQEGDRIVFPQPDQEQFSDQQAEQTHDPNKPFAIETDDPEYNKELAKDHNMVSREEAEQMMGKDEVARQFYDEQPATEPEPSQDAQPEAPEPAQESKGPRISQSDYAKAFRQARDNSQGPEQDRGPDL